MFSIALGSSAELRPFEPFDASQFVALIEREREQFGQWLPWGSAIDTEEKARAFIVRLADRTTCDQGRGYAIWLDGEMVGGALFRTFNAAMGNCEIGVWLAKHATGRGLMNRSCNILIDWAIHQRKMARIEWHCAVENVQSRKVAQRLGMKLDGVMRKSFPDHDFRHDVEVWSLLSSDVRPDINEISP